MSDARLVVSCTATGTWLVRAEDRDEPLSRHSSVTAAESAALSYATRHVACEVVVRDRYGRIHEATAAPRRP